MSKKPTYRSVLGSSLLVLKKPGSNGGCDGPYDVVCKKFLRPSKTVSSVKETESKPFTLWPSIQFFSCLPFRLLLHLLLPPSLTYSALAAPPAIPGHDSILTGSIGLSKSTAIA
jgi:hypothetical protein